MTRTPRPLAVSADIGNDQPQIVAIIPASPGWWAVWRDLNGEVLEPVAVFALVECAWRDSDVPAGVDRVRYTQAMVHSGTGDATLELASRENGYCGLRFYAPGAEPMPAWASDARA